MTIFNYFSRKMIENHEIHKIKNKNRQNVRKNDLNKIANIKLYK